jgi:hypothetical protein
MPGRCRIVARIPAGSNLRPVPFSRKHFVTVAISVGPEIFILATIVSKDDVKGPIQDAWSLMQFTI